MKTNTDFNAGYGLTENKPAKRLVRDYRAGGLVYTVVHSDVKWLDMELSNAIDPWIKSGQYKENILVIRDIVDWADFKVIERIKLVLNSSNLPGRIVIQDLTDCIKVIWAKE